jgi:hypothetical protein
VKRRTPPVLITDAERSLDDQLRSRQIRYVLMMLIRAVCLVVAAVLVGTNAPLLWLWVPLCVAGMIVIPWLAVILANDRPPKEKHRLANRLHRGEPSEPAPHGLPTEPSTPPAPPRTIDADS